jgi:hypothetical protein
MKINIKGLDKAEVLAALYNGSRQMGMGFFHTRGAYPMTVAEAQEYIEKGDDSARMFPNSRSEPLYFDYLEGRPLKSDISGDEFDTWGYDRDNGEGKALEVLTPLFS